MFSKSTLPFILASACMALTTTVHAGTLVVVNLNDSGAGSLREAIDSANANAGMDTIEFNAGLSGTIVLASFLPPLTDDVDILGPGAETITVSGNSLHKPLAVTNGVTTTISGLTVANGQAESGGGITNEGNLTLIDCVLSGNTADVDGGAIENFGGTLMVSQSTLTGNSTTEGGFGFGAAISNDSGGDVTIVDSTLAGNSADFSGGGLDNQGTATILRSTLSSNDSDFGGGIENSGTLIIRNSTLSGNTGDTMGGGIDNFGGDVTLEFATLTGNSASSGGGIGNNSAVTVKNSLIVNSTSGSNCDNDGAGAITALGTNFATDASCTGFTQSTPGGVNLGPLIQNGGPTQTHALQTGSVAIDAATDCTTVADGPSPVTQDQRGVSRPQGAECDSGSFEAIGTPSDEIFYSGFEDS